MFFVLFVFSFSWFMAGRFNSRSSVWGVASLLCRRRCVFWQDFKCFLLGFWSQIYAHPSTSVRHAPPSSVSRRLPPLLQEVSAAWITGARHVVLTRQRIFALWLRVKATFRLFKPCLAAPGVYGVGSDVGCLRCQGVFYMRRHSGKV
jgi:hypothetical protein